MSETLYLIAHSVRGQPAFDIAIQMPMDDEIWWIIPTSGHRAYPYWTRTLAMFMFAADELDPLPLMPPDWPDHYWAKGQVSDLDQPKPELSLASALGLVQPREPIKRRI